MRIGNSVPPLFIRSIASHVRGILGRLRSGDPYICLDDKARSTRVVDSGPSCSRIQGSNGACQS
jgi:hypothetical protein